MKIINKKAKFNYETEEVLEAGIVLTGAEVKAIRKNSVDFQGSYVKAIGGEFYVVNLHIGVDGEKDTRRSRKLLLNKKEIISFTNKAKEKKLTLIPISLYTKARLIKLELGLVRGKRTHEKRAAIKARDIKRDIEEEFKDMGTH